MGRQDTKTLFTEFQLSSRNMGTHETTKGSIDYWPHTFESFWKSVRLLNISQNYWLRIGDGGIGDTDKKRERQKSLTENVILN